MFENLNLTNLEEPVIETEETILPEPIIKANWTKKDSVFAVLTLVSSILLVSLSLFAGFTLGFTISYFLLFLLTVSYINKSGGSSKFFSIFCAVVSLPMSFIFAINNDAVINILSFFTIALLYGLFISLPSTQNNKGIFSNLFDTFFISTFENSTEPYNSYTAYCKENNKKGINKQFILGLAISIPLLLVVLPLLINSDAAFEGLMTKLFSNVGSTIIKILLGTILSLFLFVILFSVKNRLNKSDFEFNLADSINIPCLTSVTVFTVVSIFYFIYLFSQLAYFFSAFSGFLPKGYEFTLADYARRGFFELCGVCSINMFIIMLFSWLSPRGENGKLPISFRISSSIICFFSFLFTATAFSKMFLYIKNYGFTRLRLITSLFMVFLVLLFIGLLIYIFSKKFGIAKYAITIFAALLLITGLVDIDRTIAYYNVTAYNNGILKQIDVEHLGELSDSAVPYLVGILNGDDKELASRAANELYYRTHELFEREDDKFVDTKHNEFGNYNYSREKAKQLISQNFDKIKELKTVKSFNYY